MSTNANSLPLTIGPRFETRSRRQPSFLLVAVSIVLALVVASIFLPPGWIGASSAGDEVILGP